MSAAGGGQSGPFDKFTDAVCGEIMFRPAHRGVRAELTAHLEPSRYIGRCPQQVEEFLKEQVAPALAKYQDCLKDEDTELKV